MAEELQSGPTLVEDDLGEDDEEGEDNLDEDEDEDEGEDEDEEENSLLGLRRPGSALSALLERVQQPQLRDEGLAVDDATQNLTTSALEALQQTEDKVVNLLEIASQTAAELARVDTSDDTRERLHRHIDSFLSTTHEIHQTLREQIKQIPTALTFEGHSYDAKMDFEIAKMQTHIVRSQLDHILSYIEEQQQTFQRPPDL